MSEPPSRALEIRLIDQRVGWLVQANGRTGIRFDPQWRMRTDRRVFSLSVEDTALADVKATPQLPTWFENLLLEGELRNWILRSEPELRQDDLSFLARVGSDLLGAATLHAVEEEVPTLVQGEAPSSHDIPRSNGLRWSLAGVQLKLSLSDRGGRFTIPVRDEIGSHIAKFADPQYPGVPVTEHATMEWARASGLDTAPTRLISASAIDEIPFSLQRKEEPVLLVQRFDREDGQRIHAEEFAQALCIRPEEKYRRLGWRHHLRLVSLVAPQDLAEYLRRLLFILVSGNSDAHHKNHAFVFPDGRKASLAPVYDQVSVVAWKAEFPELKDELPFKLGRSRRYEDATMAALEHLLDQAKVTDFVDDDQPVNPGSFPTWARTQMERILDAMPVGAAIAGPAWASALQAHHQRLPLLRR